MVSRDDNTYVIYPLYFDKSISRLNGRRVPKKYAIEKPSLESITKAAKFLKLSPVVQKDAAHPLRPWKKDGRLLINKKESKRSLVLQIAKLLQTSDY